MDASTAAPARAIRLRRDATIAALPDGCLTITTNGGALRLTDLRPGGRAAIAALARADLAEAGLQRDVAGSDGVPGLVRWQALIAKLDAAGLIERTVLVAGQPAARLVRNVPGRGPGTIAAAPALARLSRFTVVRATGGTLVAERPGGHATVEITPAVAGLVAALASWMPVDEATAGCSPQLTRAVADLLAGADLLAPGGPGEADAEVTDQALAQWAPADLWLHASSRGIRLTAGYGGSYPLAGRFEPLPAVPAARTGHRIELARPDLEVAAKSDPPFTEVLEQRRSVRAHDDAAPITVAQLGELLYRSARIRRTFGCADGQEAADRPYPGGGAVHELEIYPLITRCAGAPAGLWHYAAADHALEHVADPGPATAALVGAARSAGLMDTDPQVVLIVAARFGRVMWKYHAIGYSLVLKHVGVLYQTIYLVATAMGLAVCGLGGGDAADFAAASGLPYHAEGSVGELVVGTPASQPQEDDR